MSKCSVLYKILRRAIFSYDSVLFFHLFFCSSKSKIPVWPFVVLSCFGGAYALIPYFVLWRPPAPPVEESELRRWPLNFLESKITSGVRRFISFRNILTSIFIGYKNMDSEEITTRYLLVGVKFCIN